MNIYVDTEFTLLSKNGTLISIGCVNEDGHTFYAELTDYDKSQVNDWLKENVIANLCLTNGRPSNVAECTILGTKKEVADKLTEWLKEFNQPIQFISDVCHFDFMYIIDLYGTAFDLPEFISPTCIDINEDIAQIHGVPSKVAFDYNREMLAGIDGDDGKHNALFDAKIIKMICDKYNVRKR